MPKQFSLARDARRALVCSSAIYLVAGAGVAVAQEGVPSGESLEEYDQPIVVTGSRIVRRDYTSDSPIVTVAPEIFESSSSVSVDEQLKELPQFTGGASAVTGGRDVQQLPTNSPGIATVDLRGLGANRTLVLLDGRRITPANATGVVDINIIPKAALQGVEVITGGAASTYGADAVAGVVNFQLKKNFTGVDIDLQYGMTDRGDGETFDGSVLIGSDFADGRGNAIIGLNVSDREPVYDIDIPFRRRAYTDPNYTGGGTFQMFPGYTLFGTSNLVTSSFGPTNLPTQAAMNQVFGSYGYVAGDVVAGTSTDVFFNPDGTLFSVAPGAVSGSPVPNFNSDLYPYSRILATGALAPNTPTAMAQVPLRRYSMFAHSYYDLTDDITIYAQGTFNHSKVQTQSFPTSVADQWGMSIPFDAATCGVASGHPVSDDLCTLLASRTNPDGVWGLNWPGTWLGPQRLDTSLTTYEVLLGVRGNLPVGDWTYDAYASHGRSSQETRYNNFVNLSNLQKLINLPNYGANATFFNPRIGLDGKCTSGLNPFTVTEISDDCKAIVSPELHTLTEYSQNNLEINLQGKLAELPAGEVRLAVGADYRENSFDYSPDAAFRSDNPLSLTAGVFSVLPAGGSTNVKEIYGEVLVPVLSDLPMIQELSINAGIRHSDYNTEGGVTTWKVTGDWDVADWLKFRGGYQHANRAPNIAELFQPGTYQTVSWPDHDPCSNLTLAPYGNVAANPDRAQVQALCNAIAGTTNVINDGYVGNQPRLFTLGRDFVVGNPNVNSETAKSWTFGTVIRPPFAGSLFDQMTLSVDYYNVRLKGAIQSASTQFVYEQCFNADGSSNSSYDPNNEFCQLIIRDSTTGFWLATKAEYQNLGLIATSGVDATFDWRIDAPGFGGEQGSVFLNTSFNWVEKFKVQATPGATIIDYRNTNGFSVAGPTGTPSPQFRWKLNTNVGYDFGLGSLALGWRHRPGFQPTGNNALPVGSYDIFDLSGKLQVTELAELRFGIDNLLDKEPPIIGAVLNGNTNSGVTDAATYDILGRRFYMGAKFSF